LQELYVNLIRKKVSIVDARRTISDYCSWRIVDNDAALLMEGTRLHEKWRTSFWDALILAAAKKSQVGVIWSEDYNPGQKYDGIEVVNPLLS